MDYNNPNFSLALPFVCFGLNWSQKCILLCISNSSEKQSQHFEPIFLVKKLKRSATVTSVTHNRYPDISRAVQFHHACHSSGLLVYLASSVSNVHDTDDLNDGWCSDPKFWSLPPDKWYGVSFFCNDAGYSPDFLNFSWIPHHLYDSVGIQWLKNASLSATFQATLIF